MRGSISTSDRPAPALSESLSRESTSFEETIDVLEAHEERRRWQEARGFQWRWLAAGFAGYVAGALAGWIRSATGASSGGQAHSKSTEIDRRYSELRCLMMNPAPDSKTEAQIQTHLTELRQLQREEATAMKARFEANLHLKPGEGYEALRNARALLAADEDPASANASS